MDADGDAEPDTKVSMDRPNVTSEAVALPSETTISELRIESLAVKKVRNSNMRRAESMALPCKGPSMVDTVILMNMDTTAKGRSKECSV